MTDDEPATPMPDTAEAAALIDGLRRFADGLGPVQRRLLAALLAPGIDAAWRQGSAGDARGWDQRALPDHLAAAIRARPLRIVDG